MFWILNTSTKVTILHDTSWKWNVPRKFREISWKRWSSTILRSDYFSMSNREIQLTDTRKLDKNTTEIVVETKPKEVRPASISTLFLRYSTKKERVILFFGFACTWLLSLFISSCHCFRNSESVVIYVLWRFTECIDSNTTECFHSGFCSQYVYFIYGPFCHFCILWTVLLVILCRWVKELLLMYRTCNNPIPSGIYEIGDETRCWIHWEYQSRSSGSAFLGGVFTNRDWIRSGTGSDGSSFCINGHWMCPWILLCRDERNCVIVELDSDTSCIHRISICLLLWEGLSEQFRWLYGCDDARTSRSRYHEWRGFP